MNNHRYYKCELKDRTSIKAESNGWRSTLYYPGGGTYKGGWLKSQHHNLGVKENKHNLIYDGQWCCGKRHGHGMMRRRLPDGTMERIYIGQWRDDMKSGEGKQFYDDGVYYGWWQYNQRHGLGINWYKNSNIYLGEWQANVYHGLGVLFYANGNRYEGYFARGYKNGEGTFYHMHTGQIQKGIWENDICKTSMLQDKFRNQVDRPTPYPIPQIRISNPNKFINDLFAKYSGNVNRSSKTLKEPICLNTIGKLRHFVKFETKYELNSKIP